ncbi:MAG: hypothetical protein K2H38_07115 [Muribaculaceae bacterium]|nr:hypothetical protein [Muribaculaceae bacterium]MDE6554246.1 hypothetical protein [Muribaculaceae bacterium]
MKTKPSHAMMMLILALTVFLPGSAMAQEYSVASFRELPNDVSAFINPVRDLNDEDCALMKVVAPADFVFSTPLGIVKRIDKTGEIWLYMPRGSRKMTLKHAAWGVLRDYEFPTRLESHKTYEVTLKYPRTYNGASADGNPITIRDTLTVTKVDTLVVTKVDTLMMQPTRPKIPLEFDILAGIGIGGRAPFTFASLTLVLMKRHGGFIRISSHPSPTDDPIATCDRHGLIDGQQRFYSGTISKNVFMISGGPIHRITDKWTIFEGLGYADNRLDWQLAPSEGGGYVRNSYFSHKGLTAEAGAQFRWNRIVFSASVITLKGTEWFGSIGVGFRFGKGIKWPSSISR